MSVTVTKFECYIPVASDGTSQATAISTFLANVRTLATCVQDTCYLTISGVETYCIRFYGFLLPSQVSTALGYLNTLNSALGTPILCVSQSANTQP